MINHLLLPFSKQLQRSIHNFPSLILPITHEAIQFDLEISRVNDIPPLDYNSIETIYIPVEYIIAYLISLIETDKPAIVVSNEEICIDNSAFVF